jgi:hypothetical protein
MGLALASAVLSALGPTPSAERTVAAVDQFARLCRHHARPGYADAAFEALGLTARTTRPRLVPALDRALMAVGPDAVVLFWHGVGRGLYFAPTNASPSGWAGWGGPAKALREPPHEIGRRNAVAGLAWALTLVNIRHPDVIGRFVARHADRLPGDALTHGIASAAAVWHLWAPDTPHIEALCRHADGRWRRLVAEPCRTAVRDRCPELARTGSGPLFRFHPAAGRGWSP